MFELELPKPEQKMYLEGLQLIAYDVYLEIHVFITISGLFATTHLLKLTMQK